MSEFQVNSPCINVCKIDEPTQRCTGCDRTIDQITLWSRMDNDAKLAVIDEIVARRRARGETKTADEQDQNASVLTNPNHSQ